MIALLMLACSGSDDGGHDAPSTDDTLASTAETGDTDTPLPTAETGGIPTGDTGPALDCGVLPPTPLVVTRLTGPPASEDFAFDGQGNLISQQSTFLVKSTAPPSTVTPWAPAGPATASIRMLPTGDLVYHDVNTSTLYRVEPSGSVSDVFTGFGYAGGIEVHSASLVYVIDLLGLHLIDPYGLSHQLILQDAPWFFGNGVSLSEDGDALYISANDGIWAIPVDPAGTPTGQPTLWADPPADASDLLGMGVDACGNVYVTGTSVVGGYSAVWRYPAAGGVPEILVQRPGGFLSNLQWGSGIGGWDDHVLYVTDRQGTNPGYDAIEVQIPEKDR